MYSIMDDMFTVHHRLVGGAVVSWLVRLTLEQAVRLQALARDIVLCSWARHFNLTVPLSTQMYINGYW